jgi:hypothetical protein
MIVDKLTSMPTIDILPDDVLLYIFSLDRRYDPPLVAWKWHDLVHVCRRWRYLIFGSSRHLGLRLVMGFFLLRELRIGRRALDCWQTLPIYIWSNTWGALPPKNEDDVAAALEHSDRIREIDLTVSYATLQKSTALTEKSFSALESIHLESPHDSLTAVPSGFLGRCTGTLRHIHLETISFPTLPQFLLSSHDLLSLSLGPDLLVGGQSLSPGALTAILSATTQLVILNFIFEFTVSHPEQESAHPLPPDPVVLPSLTHIAFTGSVEYLERLVSGIHAPLLYQLHVTFCQHGVLALPRLCQFISRAASLRSPPRRTYLELWADNFTIKQYFRDTPHFQDGPYLVLICEQELEALEMSEAVFVYRQLSPLASSVRQLTINARDSPPGPEGNSDAARWLQLLAPFDGVQEFELYGEEGPCWEIAYALELSTSEMAREVLPTLSTLRAHVLDYEQEFETYAQSCIKSFVAAREQSGRPLIVYYDI